MRRRCGRLLRKRLSALSNDAFEAASNREASSAAPLERLPRVQNDRYEAYFPARLSGLLASASLQISFFAPVLRSSLRPEVRTRGSRSFWWPAWRIDAPSFAHFVNATPISWNCAPHAVAVQRSLDTLWVVFT